MKGKVVITLFSFSAVLLVSFLPVNAQPREFPKPAVVMRGLENVSVRATSTDDAKGSLKSIGQHAGQIESEIIAAAKKRLIDININVNEEQLGDNSKTDSELIFTIYTDLMSGTVKLCLNLDELVTPVRSSENKLIVTVWQKWCNPTSNEAPAIKKAAIELIEQFMDDYLQTNPRKANYN